MSTPTNSVAPVAPTGTSSPWSMPLWWKRITDWLRDLSPPGATTYDTGWVDIPNPAGLVLKGRRIGHMAMLFLDGPHTLPNGSTLDVFQPGVIPSQFLPTVGALRSDVTADGYLMAAIIYPSGLLRILNRSGATRSAIHASLIGPYPVN